MNHMPFRKESESHTEDRVVNEIYMVSIFFQFILKIILCYYMTTLHSIWSSLIPFQEPEKVFLDDIIIDKWMLRIAESGDLGNSSKFF